MKQGLLKIVKKHNFKWIYFSISSDLFLSEYSTEFSSETETDFPIEEPQTESENTTPTISGKMF